MVDLDRQINARFMIEQSTPWKISCDVIQSGDQNHLFHIFQSNEYSDRVFVFGRDNALVGDESLGLVLARLPPIFSIRQRFVLEGCMKVSGDVRIRTGVGMLSSKPVCILLQITSDDIGVSQLIYDQLEQNLAFTTFKMLTEEDRSKVHVIYDLGEQMCVDDHLVIDIFELVRLVVL
jgi:hypothetical protein